MSLLQAAQQHWSCLEAYERMPGKVAVYFDCPALPLTARIHPEQPVAAMSDEQVRSSWVWLGSRRSA